MLSFLGAIAITCFTRVGTITVILNAIAWSFVLLMIACTILTQLEARVSFVWRTPIRALRRALIRTGAALPAPLLWLWPWREKTVEEAEKEEIDDLSLSTKADSVKGAAGRRRIRLDFMRRKKQLSTGDSLAPIE